MSLLGIVKPPVYQDIALKAEHLRQLGLSASRIAVALDVTDKTVAKALAWKLTRPRVTKSDKDLFRARSEEQRIVYPQPPRQSQQFANYTVQTSGFCF